MPYIFVWIFIMGGRCCDLFPHLVAVEWHKVAEGR